MITIMSDLTEALAPLLHDEVRASSGMTLFRQGDPIQHYYIVRTGCVHLIRWGAEGNSAVMQRATADSVLAESSVFATAYHCDAVCISDSLLARANMSRVREALKCDPDLLLHLTRHLGREVHRMRARVELLSRRTVSDRMDGWLALNGGELPPRGQWRSVADDIGVSPEAFYRDLQRRRRGSKG
jgi:CRP/FNR family transcriptional regulator, dissimilatory nitrate respiration regulator